jgi:hypothetical protein
MRNRSLGALVASGLTLVTLAAAPAQALGAEPDSVRPATATVVVTTVPLPTGSGRLTLTSGGTVVTGPGTDHRGDLADRLDGRPPPERLVDLAPTPSGAGYWILGAEGTVYSFGDATNLGSAADPAHPAPAPTTTTDHADATRLLPTGSGRGYWIGWTDRHWTPIGDAADLSRYGLVWPTAGPLHDGFGGRSDPITGGGRQHDGLDIGGDPGAHVGAAAAGTVVSAGWRGGFGNAVEVRHGGGYTTIYAHLSELLVPTGQRLEAGDAIGTVGSTGRATGPHLHFELRLHDEPVDPGPHLPMTPPPDAAPADVGTNP